MKVFFKKLLTSFAVTALVVYTSCILVEQEKELNKLEKEKRSYIAMIEEAQMKTAELEEIKSKVNTDEYIEKYAREKLGLVMPYEIIFIDASI